MTNDIMVSPRTELTPCQVSIQNIRTRLCFGVLYYEMTNQFHLPFLRAGPSNQYSRERDEPKQIRHSSPSAAIEDVTRCLH